MLRNFQTVVGSYRAGQVMEVPDPTPAWVLEWFRRKAAEPVRGETLERAVLPEGTREGRKEAPIERRGRVPLLSVTDRRKERRATPLQPVPRLCPDHTVVIVACGPSLVPEDVDACRDAGWSAIAIKESYRLAPWAVALLSSDAYWWEERDGIPDFVGLRYCLEPVLPGLGVQVLQNTGSTGLETDPMGLRSGKHSGGAAINLAVHLGARRIVLLGYDLQRKRRGATHWFPSSERTRIKPSPFAAFRHALETMVKPLEAAGVSVVNCSRETALECFPQRPLAAVLAETA